MKRYWVLFIILAMIVSTAYAQNILIKGRVVDEKDMAMEEAVLYFVKNRDLNALTDSMGYFNLVCDHNLVGDTLVVQYLGYKKEKTAYQDIPQEIDFIIRMKREQNLLEEVVVFRSSKIASDYSLYNLDQLAIYADPTSQADPLNALLSLPVSTNTNESARPSLRGSSGNTSMVFLNNTPVYYPTKGNSLNSAVAGGAVFNTSIIKNEEIYASNPPITYGNVSGGVIDANLNDQVQSKKTLFVSTVGGALAMAIPYRNYDRGFVELYCNYTNLRPLIFINNLLTDISKYVSYDVGVHNHVKFGKSSLSLYSSLVRESGNYDFAMYAYSDNFDNKALFNNNIINYNLPFGRNKIEIDASFSYLNQDNKFGVMDITNNNAFIYTSTAFSRLISSHLQMKIGANYEYTSMRMNGSLPLEYNFYYPNSAAQQINFFDQFYRADAFVSLKAGINANLSANIGFKYNLSKNNRPKYNFQANLKYTTPNEKNKVLMSVGRYNSHNFLSNSPISYPSQECRQFTLEYTRHTKNLLLQASLYAKNETYYSDDYLINGNVEKDIFGIEFMAKMQLSKRISLQLSDTYLNSYTKYGGRKFKSFDYLNYFIKASMMYENAKWINCTLSLQTRPGTYYTSISGATYDAEKDRYIPIFSNDLNDNKYNRYFSMNINIYKSFAAKFGNVSLFFSVNNILNRKNNSQACYNEDYSQEYFKNLMGRIFFIGAIAHFK